VEAIEKFTDRVIDIMRSTIEDSDGNEVSGQGGMRTQSLLFFLT